MRQYLSSENAMICCFFLLALIMIAALFVASCPRAPGYKYIVKIILILLLLQSGATFLYADYDTSLRIDMNLTGGINDKFQLVSYLFHQINKNISQYNYIELGTGLVYQTPLPELSFLVYYQQAYSKSGGREWLIEQKPSINMNTSAVLSHIKISNQIRFEYRIQDDWHDFRIKNTLTTSLHDILLHPYIGWELFYENHFRDSLLNRIKFGIIEKVYANISLGTYYRIDFLAKKQWEFTRQLVGFQVALAY